jgi:ligand-binding SRPBCC domain-containing protein
MAIYQLFTEQKIPASIDEVWDFISSPQNLKRITPDYMGFDITSKHLPEKMYQGMIISYIVSPILGIRTPWVTEITHVKDKEFFVDEQRVGPYAMWHHEHRIEPIEGGVVMRDILTYRPPFGVLGKIANSLFIGKKVRSIFDYREKAIIDIFGAFEEDNIQNHIEPQQIAQ